METMTVSVAAKELGVSRQRVDTLIREGRIRVVSHIVVPGNNPMRMISAGDVRKILRERA